jgi:hypothetical protein
MALIKILAVAFLSVAVVGGGTYLVMNNTASVETGEETQVENETEATGKDSGSLRALLALRESVMCTFSSVVEGTGATTAGTVYASNGKMSGDFTIVQDGTTFDSHMIIDGESMYSWTTTAQGTFAYKFNLADLNGETSVSSNGQSAVSIDNPVNYECSPWNEDESKFTVPSTINFPDTSSLMNAVPGASLDTSAGAGVNGSVSQCGMCAQIPDVNAKAQCLAALSCN